MTKNQANRHLPDKPPDRNESQADSENTGTVHSIPVYQSDGTTQIGQFQVSGD